MFLIVYIQLYIIRTERIEKKILRRKKNTRLTIRNSYMYSTEVKNRFKKPLRRDMSEHKDFSLKSGL